MAPWTGIALAVASLVLSAAPEPASQADAEIVQLLEALKGSGCRFQRNGTWYDAPQAAEHLGTKRVYLNRMKRIHSAEDFIRLAGTESSMSGKAYRVACPGKPEVDSKTWLESELRRIRGAGPATMLDQGGTTFSPRRRSSISNAVTAEASQTVPALHPPAMSDTQWTPR